MGRAQNLKEGIDQATNKSVYEERHYSVNELSALWNLSKQTIRRLFQDEPGVVLFGCGKRTSFAGSIRADGLTRTFGQCKFRSNGGAKGAFDRISEMAYKLLSTAGEGILIEIANPVKNPRAAQAMPGPKNVDIDLPGSPVISEPICQSSLS